MRRCPICAAKFVASTWRCPRCDWTAPCEGGIPILAPDFAREGEGFEARFFEDLFALESANFWFRARNKLIVWALHRYFPQATSMLEIGCGTGFVLSAIERARPDIALTGSEVLVAGLQRTATRVRHASFVQMDARDMLFAEEFDVIGAFDVLEHITEQEQVLREVHAALQPNGGLLLTVPQHPFLWSAADEYAHHKRRYTRKDLLSQVQAAGFEVIRCTSFITLLMPGLLISRLRQTSCETFDPLAEYAIPAWANRMLEALLDAERLAIAAGVTLPLGGSLLLAARKV